MDAATPYESALHAVRIAAEADTRAKAGYIQGTVTRADREAAREAHSKAAATLRAMQTAAPDLWGNTERKPDLNQYSLLTPKE